MNDELVDVILQLTIYQNLVDCLTYKQTDCSDQNYQFQVEVFNVRNYHFAVCLFHCVTVHYYPVALYFT